MIISELLSQKSSPEIITITPEKTLAEMSRLITDCNIGVLMVTGHDGDIQGIVSERDLARAVIRYAQDVTTRTVGEIMTSRLITCHIGDKVVDILDIMNKHGIRHVPVMEKGALKAILSIREFNLAYQRLQAETRTDYMTGLANRRYFMEVFEQEINRRGRFGTPLSMMMVDIDNFKAINDTYGHSAGDEVICTLAGMMTHACRIYDTVARIGGEEYAILCPNTDLTGAMVLCTRILETVRKRIVSVGSSEIRFTASFGVYESTASGEDADMIIGNTDSLLYRAKQQGRDRIVSGNSATCAAQGHAEATPHAAADIPFTGPLPDAPPPRPARSP